MNELQRKRQNGYQQKAYPGCMGRMLTPFDLSMVVNTNKLLTDKPYYDSSNVPRRRKEVSRKTPEPPVRDADHGNDMLVTSDRRKNSSNKNTNGTPMKMLLAQEMSREGDTQQKPPSVVARLMGLDTFPVPEPTPVKQRNTSNESLASKKQEHQSHLPIELPHSGPLLGFQNSESRLQGRHYHRRNQSLDSIGEQECKDVYEVYQSAKIDRSDKHSTQRTLYGQNVEDKRMDLVRQKFLEAKRLATDEKLRQSKEFQDALEVLSSNRDLFLKFLQEPNSLFSNRTHDQQHQITLPAQSKRITVLKPSRSLGEHEAHKELIADERLPSGGKYEKSTRKQDVAHNPPRKILQADVTKLNENKPPWGSLTEIQTADHVVSQTKDDSTFQPTRIVVLKPSLRKTLDIRAIGSSPPVSPKPHSRESHSSTLEKYLDIPTDRIERTPEKVREIIARDMHESFSSHSLPALSAKDEPVFSSGLSNGYVGDESSFNRSENEYAEGGNFSDSEVMTPTSNHSWDFINRRGSYSPSISRASYSPESTVSREAKKRLSERWAMMAHSSQDQRQYRRSSSTLGEMLAIPEIRKCQGSTSTEIQEVTTTGISNVGGIAENEIQEIEPVSSNKNGDQGADSPRDLLRSRSLPVSSKAYDMVLTEDFPKSEELCTSSQKVKEKSGRWKVSNLFFSRSKKVDKDKAVLPAGKPIPSQRSDEGRHVTGKTIAPDFDSTCKISSLSIIAEGSCSSKAAPTQKDDGSHETSGSNQEQPSPVSVLEPPFDDEVPSPLGVDGTCVDPHSLCTNISHKLPPRRGPALEYVSAALSWDDSSFEQTKDSGSRGGSHHTTLTVLAVEDQERLLFVQDALTVSGFCDELPENKTFSSRWHSPTCPLDTSLLQRLDAWSKPFSSFSSMKFSTTGAAKQRRANLEKRLLFDCMNNVLVDMEDPALDVNPLLKAGNGSRKGTNVVSGRQLIEEVWKRMKDYSPDDGFRGLEGREYVEKLLKREVGSRSWSWQDVELMEMDGVGRELEDDLFNELMEDVVCDIITA